MPSLTPPEEKTVIDFASDYLRRGWQPISIPSRSKNPGEGWHNLPTDEADLQKVFNKDRQNIGIFLGARSNGLTDIDLDTKEAVKLADHFLPKTNAVFGRNGSARSHRVYFSDITVTEQFNFNETIVEIRSSDGQKQVQTIFPPSIHKETGEKIEWFEYGEPLRIEADKLRRAVAMLACACVLSKVWKYGIRHSLTLAVSGAMLNNGYSIDETKTLIGGICYATNDEEKNDRLKCVDTTADRLKNGQTFDGLPTLAKLTDNKLAGKISDWLGFSDLSEHTQTVNNSSSKDDENIAKKRSFPVLSDKALYGLAGEIVKTIEPHTEGDNSALLIQLLAGLGSLINKTAYFKVGAVCHFTKIFAVLVGATAQGRKGTSWGEIERILVRADDSFRDCIQNGLSSGEGLIYHVRDEQTAKKPIKKGGRIVDYQDEIIDGGASEKRAFIIEPEFARVLKVISREGNTLSSIIRQSWDTDRLRVMTKNPIKATDAQVSIVGHITETELIRNLDETETANGFANRFLWLCVKRSKYLPDGGNLTESDLNEVVKKLTESVNFARETQELKRDSKANQLWHRRYKHLSDGYGGLLGSVTSRATAQVMRLACLYALLDLSDKIRLEHLEAALALWQYCEDSAKYIFGMSIGDKVADEIFSALQSNGSGLSKTEISNNFNRNRSAKEIENSLQTLLELERIEKISEKTEGRPREIYKVKMNQETELCPTCQKELVPYQDGQKMCEICLSTTK